VPWLVIGLLAGDPAGARFANCTGTVAGLRTWCGSLTSPVFLALVFSLGALGGLVYAAIAGRSGRP
jgi:hypothetical protein